MAACAARMLIEVNPGDEPESQLLAFELMVRGSTGPGPKAKGG
jgi:DNA-binding LacI/PurR family transcriptional regulator